MTKLITTLGPKTGAELGLILPHEHIFVEFRPPDHPDHAVAQVADVVALMTPEVEKAQALGVTAMVDCTPVGVGRRVDILKAISEATGMPLVAPTGIYREPWVPAWAQAASPLFKACKIFTFSHGYPTAQSGCPRSGVVSLRSRHRWSDCDAQFL